MENDNLNPTKKIYTDDPLIKYSGTTLKAERTKQQIDGVLAEYQVKDVMWHYDVPRSVYVIFKIEEEINSVMVKVGVRVDCPTIWDRAKPRGHPPRSEQINWDVSMRAMYHFIYTHLNSAHAMKSGKVVAFLGYVATGEKTQLKDVILPRLREYAALEEKKAEETQTQDESKIVESTDYTIVDNEELDRKPEDQPQHCALRDRKV
jgi:hypothetical protein